jgi:hypothetical protein
MKPGFIGIGAQKCASSWLHGILDEHPAVSTAAEKEINFFSYHYDHGYEWYERQFEPIDGGTVAGEFSPSYFCHPLAPRRIHAYLPEAPIILTLRDPVERALSNHRHEIRVGNLRGPDFTFEKGLANNPMYLEQSRYATHLKNWLRWFSREQMLIVLKDEIDVNPLGVARSVYGFIGVDPEYVPANSSARFNPSYVNRSDALRAGKDRLYSISRTPWLQWTWKLASTMGIRSMYRRINQLDSSDLIPEPRPDTLEKMKRAFAPEIDELEELLGRSLDAWRN